MVNDIRFIKRIRRWGTSMAVSFAPEKLKQSGFNEGDLVEVILRNKENSKMEIELNKMLEDYAVLHGLKRVSVIGYKEGEEGEEGNVIELNKQEDVLMDVKDVGDGDEREKEE